MPIIMVGKESLLTYGEVTMLRLVVIGIVVLLSAGCAGYKVNNIHISYTPDSKQYIETTISLDN